VSLTELLASDLVRCDHSFSGMTTYKFGGPARWYAEIGTEGELMRVLAARRGEAEPPPVFVLGRGSNVVVSDQGFDGLVIRLVGDFNSISLEEAVIRAGAGVPLPVLARYCASISRGGLEFYVGIPGTVGGAVVMNAGGHGSDTSEWLLDATLIDMATAEKRTAGPGELGLSYRRSAVSPNEIVIGARFRTVERAPGEGEQLMREITAWRRAHQPGGTFNAGSVFKNPPGDAAGRIIDAAGLKGVRCGGAAVSERHANFFVAEEGATAQDVFDLVNMVRSEIRQRTGVDLQPEIRFIGEFGEYP
jgi:UDP-N-acetylmuramate dehydrogenase